MLSSPSKYDNSTFYGSNYNDVKWIEYYTNKIDSNKYNGLEEMSVLYYERAKHNYRLGKFSKCNTDLENSHRLLPNDENLVSFSFIYEKLGNTKKSLSLLNDYQKKYPEEEFIKDYIHDIKDIECHDNILKKNFEILKDWLIIENSFLDNIKIKFHTNENREIFSQKEIGLNESILEISLKCMMTTELGKETEIGKEVVDKNVSLYSKHNWISFILLENLYKSDSMWRTYIDILPKKFDNIPIFFKKYYLNMLAGCTCLSKITSKITSLQTEYKFLFNNLETFKKYSLAEYIWARTVVITRIYGVVIDSIKTQALVPFADMFNHDNNPDTHWFFDDTNKVFKIVSKKKFSANIPIYDSYGKKCNSRFFVNYGFVLDRNLENSVRFIFDLKSTEVSGLKYKRKFLTNSSNKTHILGKIEQNRNNFNIFLSKVRYYVCNNDILFDKPLSTFLVPISIKNEINALKYIMRMCINHVRKYSSSTKNDLDIVLNPLHKHNRKYSIVRNCIIMRYGEKLIYDYYIKMTTICIKLLTRDFEDLIETNLLLDALSGKYHLYVSDSICHLLNVDGKLDKYLFE
jgi:histone-lysine N-methyltransferase SETD3